MPNRRKVNFQGQMVDAESVEFEADKELWSTYILHDGTALKIKAVLTTYPGSKAYSAQRATRYIWSKPHRYFTSTRQNHCGDNK